MANTFRDSGKHQAVVSASAAILSGALVYQEGILGIAITDAESGASLNVDTEGRHIIAAPSGTVKGDKLYASLASESVGLTLNRTGTGTFICVARGDRDADGKALVELLGKGQLSISAAISTELEALAAAIPTPAVASVATADADNTYGAPEATLINELKTQVNALLAALRTAGIVTP